VVRGVVFKGVGVRAERSGVRISATQLFYWLVTSDLNWASCLLTLPPQFSQLQETVIQTGVI